MPWRDLPEHYGPWQTCYERFRRWQADGTWQRLLAQAQTRSDAVGEVDWEIVVDATIVRAHQHAAGPEGGPGGYLETAAEADQALGTQPRRADHQDPPGL